MWSWHLSAICEHLEAVTYGEIQYLIINIPPRHTKSTIVSVAWPTWEWGPANIPWLRYVYSSYAESLSKRDALRSRRIIQSPFYQRRWGDRFQLTSDQNQKTRYVNDKTGFRLATSVRGLGTGEGGERVVCDDPHNVIQTEFESVRKETLTWWDETMSSRLNDEKTSAYVLIGQRTHSEDLFGHLIDKGMAGEIDLVKLILPARYEKERELKLQTKTPLKFKDPRTKEGQSLDEHRYSNKALKKLEGRMSKYAVAGQLQQRPSPRGGGIFQIEKFVLESRLPQKNKIIRAIRYWDKAGTEKSGAYTAGVWMFYLENDTYFIADVSRGQWGYAKREGVIEQTARLDNQFVITKTYTEQEPGSGGKESAERTVRNLRYNGYPADRERVTGDKVTRSEPYQTAIEKGKIILLEADWNRDFIHEHALAPVGKYKDQWDSASGAFNRLAGKRKRVGVWGR